MRSWKNATFNTQDRAPRIRFTADSEIRRHQRRSPATFGHMKGSDKKNKGPVLEPMFFSLLGGKLEDALLIYSNLIDEPIEVDPALDALTEPCIGFMFFRSQLGYKEGLAEIERALLKQIGVVIKRRKGKVIAEPKSGPSKAKRSGRPSAKPLHEVILHVPAHRVHHAYGRWPGEQSRKRLKDGAIELHLKVPNLDPVYTWLAGTTFEVIAMSPPELRQLLRETLLKIVENHGGAQDSDDEFPA